MERRMDECVLCRSFVHTTGSSAQTRIHHRRFVHIHNMNCDVRTALLTKDIRGENGEGVRVPLLIIHSVLKRDQSRSIANGEGAERSIVRDLETQRRGEDTRDAQRRKKNGANGTVFQNGVRRILNRQRRLVRVERNHHDDTRDKTQRICRFDGESVGLVGVERSVQHSDLTHRINLEGGAVRDAVSQLIHVVIRSCDRQANRIEETERIVTNAVQDSIGEEGSVVLIDEEDGAQQFIVQATIVRHTNPHDPLRLDVMGEGLLATQNNPALRGDVEGAGQSRIQALKREGVRVIQIRIRYCNNVTDQRSNREILRHIQHGEVMGIQNDGSLVHIVNGNNQRRFTEEGAV